MIRSAMVIAEPMSKSRVSKSLTVTLPPEYLEKIEEQKTREIRSASEIIREALRAYYGIGQDEPPQSFGHPNARPRRKAASSS
jgi:hypothetical protein